MKNREYVKWDGTEEGIPQWARDAGWQRQEFPACGDDPAHVVVVQHCPPGSDSLLLMAYVGDTFVRNNGKVSVSCIKGRNFRQCIEDSRLSL